MIIFVLFAAAFIACIHSFARSFTISGIIMPFSMAIVFGYYCH